ncbi:Large ribosomal subunit protein uL18 [Cardamine amara subsp. amara]|uniref:Large ribosomal subunit protein uL18 n=1 Tax=Cardamine amara subsp. amara TaxID=228776 RepID=A0ABD0Z4D2_CARAN
MEALYKKVHAAIRADPLAKKAEKQSLKEHKRFNLKRLSYEQRKANLVDRIRTLNSAGEAIHEDDDE